jgi:hypothetical protein
MVIMRSLSDNDEVSSSISNTLSHGSPYSTSDGGRLKALLEFPIDSMMSSESNDSSGSSSDDVVIFSLDFHVRVQ